MLYSEIGDKDVSRKDLTDYTYELMTQNMKPHWFITFHYKDGNCTEKKIVKNTAHLKNVLNRTCHKKRTSQDVSSTPKVLIFNEYSRWGTSELHTHLIIEGLPKRMNTQKEVEKLFRIYLPSKVKSMSDWKRIDVQRIITESNDIWRLANYLTKQTSKEWLPLDIINSDLR